MRASGTSWLRRILLIDHDTVKLVNLNRILHATKEDAELGRYKVEILKRRIEAMGLGCEVEAIVGSILIDAILQRLKEADLMFGCVDKDYPRTLLCKYAYQYSVPYIDVAPKWVGMRKRLYRLMHA